MNQIVKTITVLLVTLACGRPALAQAQTHFTEVAERAGVADSERNALNANQYWGDFDNDGYLDVYVSTSGEFVSGRVSPDGFALADTILAMPSRLYHNNQDGTFTDVAAQAGVADTAITVGGAPWGDFDNDGDLDLLVTSGSLQGVVGLHTWLHQNNGDGTFTEVATRAGVSSDGGGIVFWVDYDNDGWLDFYLCLPPAWDAQGNVDLAKSIPSKLYRNNRNGSFTDVAARARVAEYGNGGVWGDYDEDGDLDFYLVGGGPYPNPSRLYRNNGDGTFTDVAVRAGVDDVSGVQAVNVAWGDYDNDGHLDLYRVNNDAANELFRNKGNGTFKEMAADAGVADDKTGFADGAIWGDYDNDGFLDLYVLNIGSSSPCRLYHNNGDGTFTDVGLSTEANIPDGGAGAWGDYDNDGFLDLFVTNVASSSPIRLFHNSGDGTFAEVGISAGVNSPDGAGAAWGDYDNDGFLDLCVAGQHFVGDLQVGAPNLLFHNEGNANHYLVLQLKGTISNRDAIGAKVIAVTGKTRQRRDVESAGSGYVSQPSLPVEFGFGSAAVVDSLIIRWPSGIVQVMTQVSTDQYLTLAESRESEPTAVLEEQFTALPGALSLSQNYPNPFNSGTVIRFALPSSAVIELGVYDLTGQRVALLMAGTREAGTYAVNWDGRDERGQELGSGTYLYRLRAGEREETRKLALVR